MPEFPTFPLQPSRLAEALPLLRIVLAGLDRAGWDAHCAVSLLLASAAPGGALHGIASWRPDDDFR